MNPLKGESNMKNTLLNMLEQIQEDAKFHVYNFEGDESGTFRSAFKDKTYVLPIVTEAKEIRLHKSLRDVLMVDGVGVSMSSFSDNIDYPTEGTEGYMSYISKYNPYHKVFIKLDKEAKTISFKLGDKEKTLQLIEGTGFVSKPYYKKAMKCESVERLESHIEDEFWNPRMVDIGRLVLGIKDLTVSSFKALA
jgi:hypothetical protein